MSGILFRGEPLSTEDGGMTVAQRLFHERFYCTVPEIFYQTEESMKFYGSIHYNDPAITQGAMHRERRLYIPPAGMVMYLEQGAPLQLENIEDSVTIYNLIIQHLKDWKQLLEGLVGEKPPIDDLRLFDEFAEILYPLVRYVAPYNEAGSYFRHTLNNVGRADEARFGAPLSRQAPVDPGTATDLSGEKRGPVDPGHQSIAEIITREAFKKQWV